MAEASIDIVAGYDGFKYHSAATVTSVSYDALVVQEDTVFTLFTVTQENGTSTNVLSARGMSGITFQQGAYLPAGKGNKITGFVISTGSAIAY
jgi:hypothetical protein